MPAIANQNASAYNSNGDETIRLYGCALCSGLVCSQHYGSSSNNTVSYFYAHYWDENGYTFCAPNAAFSGSITTNILGTIKSEIDAGRPVVVHGINGASQHWVVAYKYINSASSESNIYVLNPWNQNQDSLTGISNKTLTEAMNVCIGAGYSIDRIRTTSSQ